MGFCYVQEIFITDMQNNILIFFKINKSKLFIFKYIYLNLYFYIYIYI